MPRPSQPARGGVVRPRRDEGTADEYRTEERRRGSDTPPPREDRDSGRAARRDEIRGGERDADRRADGDAVREEQPVDGERREDDGGEGRGRRRRGRRGGRGRRSRDAAGAERPPRDGDEPRERRDLGDDVIGRSLAEDDRRDDDMERPAAEGGDGGAASAPRDDEDRPRRRRRRGRRGGRGRSRGERESTEVSRAGRDRGDDERPAGGAEDLDDEPLPTSYGMRAPARPASTREQAGERRGGDGDRTRGGEGRDATGGSGRRRRRRRSGEGRSGSAKAAGESGRGRRSRRGGEERTGSSRVRRADFSPVSGAYDEDDEGLEFLGVEDADRDAGRRESRAEGDDVLAESGLDGVRDVPSWVEAIGIVIAGNLDARTRGRGDGGRRDR